MGTKTASKFTSLKFLLEMQEDYYRGRTGNDYDPASVDSVVSEKLSNIADRNNEAYLKELENAPDHAFADVDLSDVPF